MGPAANDHCSHGDKGQESHGYKVNGAPQAPSEASTSPTVTSPPNAKPSATRTLDTPTTTSSALQGVGLVSPRRGIAGPDDERVHRGITTHLPLHAPTFRRGHAKSAHIIFASSLGKSTEPAIHAIDVAHPAPASTVHRLSAEELARLSRLPPVQAIKLHQFLGQALHLRNTQESSAQVMRSSLLAQLWTHRTQLYAHEKQRSCLYDAVSAHLVESFTVHDAQIKLNAQRRVIDTLRAAKEVSLAIGEEHRAMEQMRDRILELDDGRIKETNAFADRVEEVVEWALEPVDGSDGGTRRSV